MFCTSTRRRQAFAGTVQQLTDTPGLRLRVRAEYDLSTHDLAIPIKTSAEASGRQLRVLLLSAADVTQNTLPATMTRIQRFTALTGGVDLAIVFLHANSSTSANATTAKMTGLEGYTALRAALFSQPHPPILPLATLAALPTLLVRHAAALGQPVRGIKPAATPFELLQLCTAASAEQGQLMDQHMAFRITDLLPNVPALARVLVNSHEVVRSSELSSPALTAPGSASHGGDTAISRELRSIVGDIEFGNLIDFWAEEWVVE